MTSKFVQNQLNRIYIIYAIISIHNNMAYVEYNQIVANKPPIINIIFNKNTAKSPTCCSVHNHGKYFYSV